MKRLLTTLIFMFAAVAGASAQDADNGADTLRLAGPAKGPLPAGAARQLDSHSGPARPAFYDGAGWQLVDDKPGLFNVKAYGAKGNDSANDTAAITAAINAAEAAGGSVFFPPGTYRVTGLTVDADNVSLVSPGLGAVRIAMTSAAGDTIALTPASGRPRRNVQIVNLLFQPAVARTGGAEIRAPSFEALYVLNCEFMRVNQGVYAGNVTTRSGKLFLQNFHGEAFNTFLHLVRVLDAWVVNGSLNGVRPAAKGIHLDGGCEGNNFVNLGIVNTATPGTATGYGLHVKALLYTGSPARFNKFLGVYLDSFYEGLRAEDGVGQKFTNCWFSDRPSVGAIVTGTADDYSFVDCDFKNSGTAGIYIGGSGRHLIQGGSVVGNNSTGLPASNPFSAGIVLDQSAGGLTRVIGVLSTNGQGFPGVQSYGVWATNSGGRYTISLNDFIGNGTGSKNLVAAADGVTRIYTLNQE